MRAVAKRIRIGLSSIQFHFGSQHEFAEAMVAYWGQCVSSELLVAAGEARGLERVWRLCCYWSESREGEILAGDVDADCPSALIRRARLQSVLRDWMGDTTRALHQARILGELKPGVEVSSAAMELHAILWSRTWATLVYGESTAARTILAMAGASLQKIAATNRTVPSAELVTRPPDPLPDFEPHAFEAPPSWQDCFERSDPRYYAFARMELLGERPSIALPPEVTEDDVAQAREYTARNLRRAGIEVAPSAFWSAQSRASDDRRPGSASTAFADDRATVSGARPGRQPSLTAVIPVQAHAPRDVMASTTRTTDEEVNAPVADEPESTGAADDDGDPLLLVNRESDESFVDGGASLGRERAGLTDDGDADSTTADDGIAPVVEDLDSVDEADALVLHDQPTISWFEVLTPADALFHAFVRAQNRLEDRTMLDPPAVTEEDEAKAESFAAFRFADRLKV